ncbi:MAG TPA: CHASE2 domain-containing protein [Solirubrobacteraceae bacterium]|jgi:CHASE2 domain-containing sensor protein
MRGSDNEGTPAHRRLHIGERLHLGERLHMHPAGHWRLRIGGRRRLLLGVALAVAGAGLATYFAGALRSVENSTVDLRFALRPASPTKQVLVVGIDERTLRSPGMHWPFPRSLDARAIDVLRADGARTIAYDVQFTQPTVKKQDLALYDAVARARNVVLATTEIGAHGETEVLGGNANLARAHARPAAANFYANSSGVIQKYPYAVGGLKTMAVVTAEAFGAAPLSRGDFEAGQAWIDFRGPPGTLPHVSFSQLIAGKVPPSEVAGKIVVIGATAPVLQDIHETSTGAHAGMSGPEVQASAIWTALHGNPLRSAPAWLAILAILFGAAVAPLCWRLLRPGRAFLLSLLLGGLYLVAAQLAFDAGHLLPIVYPLATLVLGALGMLLASYLHEAWDRQLAERYGALLEQTVSERTAELQDTQLEVIQRLARAGELRDEQTGMHVERVGRICEVLALGAGMTREQAERLRVASILHDVGKIGVPDRVLLKAGKLDAEEWELMKAHTTTGASLLADARSPLLQIAQDVARTHHERFDGSGYPVGLAGEQIPLVGRICAIADVFDALSTARPYKEPWPLERIVDEISRESGTHFDPRLVEVFMKVLPQLEEMVCAGRAPDAPPVALAPRVLVAPIR